MPIVIDPETMNVDELPVVWSPVQWELTEEEQLQELDTQATANLLWLADVPEAMLRLLLNEYDIERAFEPPEDYDADEQGEWDESLLTFQFKRRLELLKVERKGDSLYAEYRFEDLGYWAFEIEPERVSIHKL
jgi:hypothetical protein